MYVDNFSMFYNLPNFLFVFMTFVSWFWIIYFFYKISLQLQDHVTDDAVDDIVEDGDAEHIFGQLRIDIETKDQRNITY